MNPKNLSYRADSRGIRSTLDPQRLCSQYLQRTLAAVEAATAESGDGFDASDLADALVARLPGEPNGWRHTIATLTSRHVIVTGTLERRLLAIETGPTHPSLHGTGTEMSRWVMADLAGHAHASRAWPAWAATGIHFDDPCSWLSTATLTRDAVHRLSCPRILLAALYRKDVFPLPRFSLSISDLARAARATLSANVQLLDMQLGATVADILTATDPVLRHDESGPGTGAEEWLGADIVGLSATFGQHDLLTEILDALFARERPPLVLAGGSLTARNERLLLERYPRLLVARGAGEPTITDTIAHWHADLDRDQVRGIAYAPASPGTNEPFPIRAATTGLGALTAGDGARALSLTRRPARTAQVANRDQGDYLPELDLLDATFAAGGVAQLESSRGCTSSCSFCPRGHKGTWAGPDHTPDPERGADAFDTVLAHMRPVFDRYPQIARVLYLVDEEFIGADHDAVPRARALAETVSAAGYQWESSCRVDQVTRLDADRDWHIERAHLWRHLLDHGLRRCLFGIESGVTTILERFHKETTAEQNAHAIRTLSALGVPTRYTYITFDHLMTRHELQASYAFQARTDLVLRPVPHLSIEAIVDGVHDPGFVAEHSSGQPFHRGISYMLVSMECLIGAAYTRRVQAAGLAGATRPSMGRVDARYADPAIGICSDLAQRWIDRHFTLDYTLKSLEKALDGTPRHAVRGAREVFKDAAHTVLADMLTAIHDTTRPAHHSGPNASPHGGPTDQELAVLRARVHAAMNTRNHALKRTMADTLLTVLPVLPPTSAAILTDEHHRWSTSTGWNLINDATACTD
jgi:radical SAM superfamily enzyme YgiQ (UPF0313 family)